MDVNSITHDKHLVYSKIAHCLNPAIITPMPCVVAVSNHYHLDQLQCPHLRLFHADMDIIRVHMHTNTHMYQALSAIQLITAHR
jgi:hypothetical protein